MSASYAAQHPERVDSLVLLCPGVDIEHAVQRMVCTTFFRFDNTGDTIQVSNKDPRGIEIWKEVGHLPFPCPYTKNPINVPYSFFTSCGEIPAYPKYNCPAVLVHGKNDDVVSLDEVQEFLKQVRFRS